MLGSGNDSGHSRELREGPRALGTVNSRAVSASHGCATLHPSAWYHYVHSALSDVRETRSLRPSHVRGADHAVHDYPGHDVLLPCAAERVIPAATLRSAGHNVLHPRHHVLRAGHHELHLQFGLPGHFERTRTRSRDGTSRARDGHSNAGTDWHTRSSRSNRRARTACSAGHSECDSRGLLPSPRAQDRFVRTVVSSIQSVIDLR